MTQQALLRPRGLAAGLPRQRRAAASAVVPVPALADRLARSLKWSTRASRAGALGVLLVYLVELRSPWLLVIVAATVLHDGVVGWCLRACRRAEIAAAAMVFCLADWAVVLVALLITPATAPALVPIIIARMVSALPYVDRLTLLRLVAASLATGVTVGVLTRVDLVGVGEQVSDAAVTGFIVFFVPYGFASVGLDLWQHSATLLETAHRALAANEALRASQQALAAQAQEVRNSRARLVAAADQERRRIERDLHDGAQQTMVGVCLGLSLLADREPRESPLRAELRRLEDAAQDATTELRQIAHGVYPPVLAAHGLTAALEAVTRRLQVPITAHLDQVSRRAPEQEAAVYFCCREALQNVEKHAGAAATVDLSLTEDRDGTLRFVVTDTGSGFDARSGHGHGLVSMHDRIAAVGGVLSIRSSPGGTTITGLVPMHSANTGDLAGCP